MLRTHRKQDKLGGALRVQASGRRDGGAHTVGLPFAADAAVSGGHFGCSRRRPGTATRLCTSCWGAGLCLGSTGGHRRQSLCGPSLPHAPQFRKTCCCAPWHMGGAARSKTATRAVQAAVAAGAAAPRLQRKAAQRVELIRISLYSIRLPGPNQGALARLAAKKGKGAVLAHAPHARAWPVQWALPLPHLVLRKRWPPAAQGPPAAPIALPAPCSAHHLLPTELRRSTAPMGVKSDAWRTRSAQHSRACSTPASAPFPLYAGIGTRDCSRDDTGKLNPAPVQ